VREETLSQKRDKEEGYLISTKRAIRPQPRGLADLYQDGCHTSTKRASEPLLRWLSYLYQEGYQTSIKRMT
ncbi:hypothetical protein PanWU01x14_213650, partial [Parasponia andersonii]